MIKTLSYTFTRPGDTTAYQDTDLVANSTTAGSVTPMSWNIGSNGGMLHAFRLTKSDAADVTGAIFKMHFFSSSPTVTNGDNGAIAFNIAGYLGSLAPATMAAGTEDAYTVIRAGETGMILPMAFPKGTVYGLVEAKGAYQALASETFTGTLILEQ